MKKNRNLFIVWITSIAIILLVTWLLSCYLGSHSNFGKAESKRIKEIVELYGILAGITISVISLLVSVLSANRSDRQFDTEKTPTIEFVSKQKIGTNCGIAVLYFYDKKMARKLLGKESRNVKRESEILMVMNNVQKQVFVHGSYWGFELEFQSATKIDDFCLNFLKVFFYVDDEKSGCITNYVRYDEDTLGLGGQKVYRDTPYNRVLEFRPYKQMNYAKPYIKDGKYVVQLKLIYLVDSDIDVVDNVARKIKAELKDSQKIVIEMEYNIRNNLGYSNDAKHTLFFENIGKHGIFEQVSYEIRG